jgi:DNA-binding transcriptional ArsR family regulator
MERQFKGVWITAEVWLDTRLTLVEKALMAEIDSFSGNGKTFHKSNETIQLEYGVSRPTVSKAIKKLLALGYIEMHFDGRVRHLTCQADRKNVSGSPKEIYGQQEKIFRAEGKNSTPTNKEKRTTKNTTKRKEVVMPFDDDNFTDAWQSWKEYKRTEHGFKFKSETSEQASLHQLQKLSGDDCGVAIQIIGQSLANGWKGFFALKNTNYGQKSISTSDGSLIADHLRRLAADSGESLG